MAQAGQPIITAARRTVASQNPGEGRLGARLILQRALEDEVTEFLGRGRYERAEEMVSHRSGSPGTRRCSA